MPEYANFDHFARDLFLFSRRFNVSSSESEKYDPIPLMDDAWYVLDLFADGHCVLFRRIFVKIEEAVLQTDEQFFKLALPRCLELIDTNRYFYSLMLVASFLHELVTFLRDTRVCYRFHFTAYKCLAAVFKRAFINAFEPNGGWNALEEYLVKLIEVHDSTKETLIIFALNGGDPSLIKKVRNLIISCNDISDDFNLNEFENSLLMDDDIEDIKKSLDYEGANEDPLNMTWPPKDDEIYEKLGYLTFSDPKAVKDMEGFSPPSNYLNDKKDIGDSEREISIEEHSILEEYTPKIEAEAELRLGTEKFLEKMRLRTCPCCGIKCFLFSYKLFTKQIDSALTNNNEILRSP